MRRWRDIRKVFMVLMFVCMTVKVHIELRLLESTRNNASFAPWWSNESLGHLRAFPKLLDPHLQETKPVTFSREDLLQIYRLLQNVSLYTVVNSTFTNETLATKRVYNNKTFEYNKNAKASITNEPNNVASKQFRTSTIEKYTAGVLSKLNSSVIDKILKVYKKGNVEANTTPYDNDKKISENHQQKRLFKQNIFAKLGLTNNKNRQIYADTNIKSNPDPPKATVQDSKLSETQKDSSKKPPPPETQRQQGITTKLKPRPAAASSGSQKKQKANKGVSHDVDSTEVSLSQEDIAKIKKQLELENQQQKVYNEDRYGPVLRNTSILLVQVHHRLENLRYLVDSMKQVRGMAEEGLAVFSHDYWDPAINAFLRNVTDFRLMQIFFPFSIQLHPFTYPGRDPRDCTWNMKSSDNPQCLNHKWPDSYGHFREASFTQIKHHWWWKIHRVFENLRVVGHNYTGHVVFLEEDHYVSPDLLHVLRLLQRQRRTLCPTCRILALGNYNKLSTAVYKNQVEKGDWWVTKHNLGFALDVAAWKTLSTCKKTFCDFDDYNWDWTLNNIVQTCFTQRLSMLSVRFSRVIHVGSCGTHVKKNTCDVKREVQVAANRFTSGKKWLFPESLQLQGAYRNSGKPKKGNGGWGDFRDKELCRGIGNGTATEGTVDRLQFPKPL